MCVRVFCANGEAAAVAWEGSSNCSPREKGGGPKGQLEWTA
jgi:hypothetical protein